MKNCVCGSDKEYEKCCQPFHLGSQNPETAEALMRSRFSAFCKANADYLLSTHLSQPNDSKTRQELAENFKKVRWLGLRVIESREDGDTGQVEFAAFFTDKLSGTETLPSAMQPQQLHELSSFEKHNGKWFYTEGKPLPPIKLERNGPCWCGSGKKLKKCLHY